MGGFMFTPEVVQVIPHENYIVEVLFQDGKIVHYDVSHLLEKGAFKKLKDKDFYMSRCTVMNHTLAWDTSGEYNPTNCLDIAPDMLYSIQ